MVYLYDVLYELTPVGDSVVEDCSLNLSELNQDPDQRLEEPKAVCDRAQKGKPRCINPSFSRARACTHTRARTHTHI